MHESLWITFLVLLGKYPVVWLLDHRVVLASAFWGNSILFSRVAVLACIPMNNLSRQPCQPILFPMLLILAFWQVWGDISLCFFFKILFIYVTERQPAREGTQQGEWERKKQAPSGGARCGTRSRIPERRDHALSRRQTLNACATQAPQENHFNIMNFIDRVFEVNTRLWLSWIKFF